MIIVTSFLKGKTAIMKVFKEHVTINVRVHITDIFGREKRHQIEFAASYVV